MVLSGDCAERPTYRNVKPLPGAGGRPIYLADHYVFGEQRVQKLIEMPGREDAVAFAEPRFMKDFDHPNVIEIYDAQFDPDRPGHVVIVMPVLRGGSVHDRIVGGRRFSTGEVISLVGQALSALSHVHVEHRIVHRDVKPGNLLLNGDGSKLVLSDFGTAARMSSSGHVGPVRSTLPYQPPETAKEGWMEARSDLFSLGLVCFEMLSGRVLYEGLDLADMDRRVSEGRRPYPDRIFAQAQFPPHVPASLRTICRSLVATEVGDRPQSAAAVARKLRGLKIIDFRQEDGDQLEGVWRGSWPPQRRPSERVTVEVTSVRLRAGRHSGSLRLDSTYARPGKAARRFGFTTTVESQDRAAVSAFFNTVAASVAQRFPAR